MLPLVGQIDPIFIQPTALLIQPTAPFIHPYYPSKHRIDFVHYLDPFVRLLMDQCIFVFKISCFIANCGLKILSDAQVVFSRLLIPPPIDPFEKEFEEKINFFEKQANILNEKVLSLEGIFWQDVLISRDLKKFEEINSEIRDILNQLCRFIPLLENYEPHPPIYAKVLNVRDTYQLLDNQMNDYCSRRAVFVITSFEYILNRFLGMRCLPEEIQQELNQSFKILDNTIRHRLERVRLPSLNAENDPLLDRINTLRDGMRQLNIDASSSESTSTSVDFTKPLPLKNIGNSCYLASVLNALCSVEAIREQFQQPLSLEDHPANRHQAVNDQQREVYIKRLTIQQELVKFINGKGVNQAGPLSKMEFILALFAGGGSSLYRLREAIFKSGLHYEFDPRNLTRQMDAASITELLIMQFLPNCKFKWEEYTSAPEFPGLEFIGPVANMTILQVPVCQLRANQNLQQMVHRTLFKRREKESIVERQRLFDVHNDAYRIQVIDQATSTGYQYFPAQKVGEYLQWHRFTELPPVLTLQFKRFKALADGAMAKDDHPVYLPADGIIDLTPYYNAPEGAQKRARYKFKSGVVHSGGLHGGHYVAYVEINGKYYYCNDIGPIYKEQTKEEVLGRTDFYLVVLERLPEDNAVPVQQPIT